MNTYLDFVLFILNKNVFPTVMTDEHLQGVLYLFFYLLF